MFYMHFQTLTEMDSSSIGIWTDFYRYSIQILRNCINKCNINTSIFFLICFFNLHSLICKLYTLKYNVHSEVYYLHFNVETLGFKTEKGPPYTHARRKRRLKWDGFSE